MNRCDALFYSNSAVSFPWQRCIPEISESDDPNDFRGSDKEAAILPLPDLVRLALRSGMNLARWNMFPLALARLGPDGQRGSPTNRTSTREHDIPQLLRPVDARTHEHDDARDGSDVTTAPFSILYRTIIYYNMVYCGIYTQYSTIHETKYLVKNLTT